MKLLELDFLSDDTLSAAKYLLGKEIVTYIDGEETGGYITEVEAYLGLEDKAAHTFSGKVTKKNDMMFEPYGHIYVYTMHGHSCMNFVSTVDRPEGVLIRGIEPSRGIEVMEKRRGRTDHLTDGPGKLTKALGIQRNLHNGLKINGDTLCIMPGKTPDTIAETPRIGIDNKEEAVDYLYRFIVSGNPHVSKFKGKPVADNGWK